MNAGELFEQALQHWRNNKGIGTALMPYPLNDKLMILLVLQRIYHKSPDCKTIIIVDNFKERSIILEYLTNQEDEEENNREFKNLIEKGNIKILTIDYVEKNHNFIYPLLCIVYRPESFSLGIKNYISNCKFKLIILNKLLEDSEDMLRIYKTSPLLEDFKNNEINEIRINTPVEELLIGVPLEQNSEEWKLNQHYTEYINTSISIFGSLDIISQANIGNSKLNISANQICKQIAEENGWSETLDMNVPFNVQIDNIYNPMSLKERASCVYEMIRNRSKLLSDYTNKLEAINNIVKENIDKKILIINKRGEFANIVTNYINNLNETNICMNYHDKVENIPAIDINGNPIYYKSGVNKGERKYMAAKAQKTLAENLFNINKINVLSTNSSPDKDLSIDIDILIITSPMCLEIKDYLYRLDKLNIRNGKLIVYSIYCKNTVEEQRLKVKSQSSNHTKQNIANDDENNFDFVIDD